MSKPRAMSDEPRVLNARDVTEEEREEESGLAEEKDEVECIAAGFQRQMLKLDFKLRDDWGAAIWEISCTVQRRGRLLRWWDRIWSGKSG